MNKITKTLGRILILSGFVLIVIYVSGCQPTPVSEAVISKEDVKKTIGEAHGNIENQTYTAPKSWEESILFEGSNLNVEIKASIYIPDAYPIAVTAVPMEFSQEFADKFLQYFLSDKPLYKINEQMTKGEIEELILQTQLAMEKDKENQSAKENSEDFFQCIIDFYKKQWEDAPEVIEDVEAEKQIHTLMPQNSYIAPPMRSDEMTDCEYAEEIKISAQNAQRVIEFYENNITGVHGKAYLGGANPAEIKIFNDKTANQTEAYFVNYSDCKSVSSKRIDASIQAPNNVSIDLDDAVLSANEFLDYAGIDDMEFRYAEIGKMNEYDKDADKLNECYILYYSKVYNNFPETYERTDGMYSDSFRMFHSYERMTLWVNDSGIFKFEWSHPIAIKEAGAVNIELLPFDKIQSIAKQQIKNAYIWHEDSSIEKRTYVVDEITLGLMRISQPNNSDEYMLIPVWDFFGYEIYEYSKDADTEYQLNDENQIIKDRELISFLTINAVDGTVIDRSKGY